jgi:iron(III) transport system ATP-binding protein
MNELVIDRVNKTFGKYLALRDISFTVGEGEFFTLLGPSGCGKTTMLSCIAGLERPGGGVIRVGDTVFSDGATGRFLQPEERNLGMVFQSYALWPHMSVAENIALPLRLRKVAKAKQATLIDSVLEQVGLLEQRERYPHQLSGGQQQRVALARALVYSPSLLLLDEPLSNLDAKLRDSARLWLKRLQKEIGVTTLYVTHDQAEALSLSDRIAVMSAGRMLQVDTPKRIYEQPASEQVADFIGHCNFFSARVVDRGPGSSVLQVGDNMRFNVSGDSQTAVGDEFRIGIRAEKLEIHPRNGETFEGGGAANRMPGELTEVAYVGDHYEYRVDVFGHRVLVESAKEIRPGAVTVVIPEEDVYILKGDKRS